MQEQIFELSGLHCGNCVRKIELALQPFANEVSVTLDPMQMRLRGAHADLSLAALQNALLAVGSYQIQETQQNQPLASMKYAHNAMNNVASDAKIGFFSTYRPLLMIMAYLLAASVLIQLGQHAGHEMSMASSLSAHETMRYFMAGFFLTFSFFKLLNLQAFADAYAGYDLLAARWHGWGYVYPFVELGLGLAYLANFSPTFINWVTLIIMSFSAIGVIRAVMSKTKIQCACLGTVFKLPMSTVTIVEDVGMVAMAAAMLAGAH